MSRVNPDELPGGMVTLGLVIEMPDHTAKHIGLQLSRRFSRSNFSRSTANSAIKRLHEQGYIQCTYEAPGPERASNRHVATPLGERVFHDWMYDVPSRDGSGPDPALREAMYGRIELCKDEDIPRLLELANEEVTVSETLYNEASKRLREQEEAARLLKQLRPDSKKRPTERVREILMVVEPLHWLHRAKRYELVASELENIMADMQVDLPET
jgi:DNA-binding PadR family transcriptional regulator